jgi:hypothetical protein
MTVPVALRRWFVFHFIADMIFAVPLLLAPAAFLRTLGWVEIDPVTARMVGAALAGIGIESYLCRNDGIDTFRSMLRLKCIWSGAAIGGLVFSIAQGAPPVAWAVLAIFVGFGVLWNAYRLRLSAHFGHRERQDRIIVNAGIGSS